MKKEDKIVLSIVLIWAIIFSVLSFGITPFSVEPYRVQIDYWFFNILLGIMFIVAILLIIALLLMTVLNKRLNSEKEINDIAGSVPKMKEIVKYKINIFSEITGKCDLPIEEYYIPDKNIIFNICDTQINVFDNIDDINFRLESVYDKEPFFVSEEFIDNMVKFVNLRKYLVPYITG